MMSSFLNVPMAKNLYKSLFQQWQQAGLIGTAYSGLDQVHRYSLL